MKYSRVSLSMMMMMMIEQELCVFYNSHWKWWIQIANIITDDSMIFSRNSFIHHGFNYICKIESFITIKANYLIFKCWIVQWIDWRMKNATNTERINDSRIFAIGISILVIQFENRNYLHDNANKFVHVCRGTVKQTFSSNIDKLRWIIKINQKMYIFDLFWMS